MRSRLKIESPVDGTDLVDVETKAMVAGYIDDGTVLAAAFGTEHEIAALTAAVVHAAHTRGITHLVVKALRELKLERVIEDVSYSPNTEALN